jgi:two-component system OmpR family response regulator
VRILVVEDQKDLQRILREMLEDEGYSVDSCSDGASGLAKAQSYSYDAIVLDLMLPEMDGWQVLQKLRASRDASKRSTPVLILSALHEVEDRCEGLDLGADDYLAKPFSHTELISRVRALIRRAAGQSSSVITISNIKIDQRSKKVYLDDAEVTLTGREYSLLEYLALHRGRVIGKDELFGHLSDEIDEQASNWLEVYVSYLRRKLGAEVIKTRRGIGYVIE